MKQVYAHFIGVGGAGMSALALVLLQRGVAVSGSDMKESRYTRKLECAGMTVHIGHDAANLGSPEIVVVSSAIPDTNPELVAARKRAIPVWPRARLLATLPEQAELIAVAGTHGKTSTSAMIASLLSALNQDPGFCIGGQVAAFGTNADAGGGDFFVVEADESDGSFVWLAPHLAVITNLEADHIDHYHSLADIHDAFRAFMQRVDSDGTLLINGDDEALLQLAQESGRRVVTYGEGTHNDVQYSNIARQGLGSTFTVTFVGADDHIRPRVSADPDTPHPTAGHEGSPTTISATIPLPGKHMVSNATAALACACLLGLNLTDSAAALARFAGVRRRFELIAQLDRLTIVDDYAHHPTEIAATLAGIRALDFGRVVVVFQPHRYTRTAAFLDDFADAFMDADRLILMDVYSAGEAPVPGISGRSIVEAVTERHPRAQVAWLPHRSDIPRYLDHILQPDDLLLTMGAGDVTEIGPVYVSHKESAGADARKSR